MASTVGKSWFLDDRGDGRMDMVPSSAPSYVTALGPYEVAALSTVANGQPNWFDAAPAEWRANGGVVDAGGRVTNHLQAVEAFSGGHYDPVGHRLFATGGGHSDGGYNGILIFDCNGAAQANGWTEAPGSSSALADVIYPPSYVSPYLDGRPVAVHTYDGVTYDAATGDLLRFGGATYSQNGPLYSKVWRFRSGAWTELTDGVFFAAYTPATVINAAERRVFLQRHDGRFGFYNIATDTWFADAGGLLQSGTDIVAVWDSNRDQILILGQAPGSNVAYTGINWAAGTATPVNYSSNNATATSTKSPFAAYDPTLDCVWVLAGEPGTMPYDRLYQIENLDNLSSLQVTERPLSATLTAPLGSKGLYKRGAFFDDWRCIFTAPNYNAPVEVIRLPSS